MGACWFVGGCVLFWLFEYGGGDECVCVCVCVCVGWVGVGAWEGERVGMIAQSVQLDGVAHMPPTYTQAQPPTHISIYGYTHTPI
jgi:hypothetical protein